MFRHSLVWNYRSKFIKEKEASDGPCRGAAWSSRAARRSVGSRAGRGFEASGALREWGGALREAGRSFEGRGSEGSGARMGLGRGSDGIGAEL